MLERRNNGEIIKSRPVGAHCSLGRRFRCLEAPSLKVHSVADVEHADMMWNNENHAASDEAQPRCSAPLTMIDQRLSRRAGGCDGTAMNVQPFNRARSPFQPARRFGFCSGDLNGLSCGTV
jgi:hypothetical protein